LFARSRARARSLSLSRAHSFSQTHTHRMLIAPGLAKRCIESFNGRVLFMPSSYSRDAATFPAGGLHSRWEPSLTLTTYYLLVVASLTGLSTLLGQTTVLGTRSGERQRAVRGSERCAHSLASLRLLPTHTPALPSPTEGPHGRTPTLRPLPWTTC
jgi:hypothetical protein